MRLSRRSLLAAPPLAPAYARAQSQGVELSVQYSIPELFRGLMENVAAAFMQRNLRDAVTRSLPDVAFHGLNRQRTLLERDIPIDLSPLMRQDPAIAAQGYSESLLSLGQVGGRQTGIGFALSTPILSYNANLVRRAGGDPEALPRDWLPLRIYTPGAGGAE